MRSMSKSLLRRAGGAVAAALAVIALLAAGGSSASAQPTINLGAVYTLTNEVSGNRVAVFDRAIDGTLTPAGMVPTGGLGTGGGIGSQGALILSQDNRWLFAVNAGSNEISVFAVRLNGLRLVDRVASGGTRPTSLTARGNLLYVLNAGGSGNITGFTVGLSGKLTPLSGSTRPVSTGASNPAQVEFSPDGRFLAVTERAINVISIYRVGFDGRPGDPMPYPSAGVAPFGFAFDRVGHLIVSETANGAPNGSTASSYLLSPTGSLSPVTAAAATHQTAACWVVVSRDGRFAYTANAGSGSISGFRIDPFGRLSLITPDGRTGVTGDGSGPIDMAVSLDGRHLYVLGNGSHAIGGFRIEANGALTPVGSVPGIVAGAVGLAAR